MEYQRKSKQNDRLLFKLLIAPSNKVIKIV